MGDLRLTSRAKQLLVRVAAAAGTPVRYLRRMSGLARSRAGYAAGCATTASGVGLNFGLGWALTLAGVLAAVSCLLLVDVEQKGPDDA